MKKKIRRQLKKSTKAIRKALKRAGKRAGSPAGITTTAFALGGLAAAVVHNPVVRERTRALFGSARELLSSLTGPEEDESSQPLLEHTH